MTHDPMAIFVFFSPWIIFLLGIYYWNEATSWAYLRHLFIMLETKHFIIQMANRWRHKEESLPRLNALMWRCSSPGCPLFQLASSTLGQNCNPNVVFSTWWQFLFVPPDISGGSLNRSRGFEAIILTLHCYIVLVIHGLMSTTRDRQ